MKSWGMIYCPSDVCSRYQFSRNSDPFLESTFVCIFSSNKRTVASKHIHFNMLNYILSEEAIYI